MTDEELMSAIAKSDETAFKELLNRYSKRVFAFAWRLCADTQQAEDLTQDVFFKVWRGAAEWKPQAKLETWLYRVLYNRFIDTRRKVKGTTEELSDDIGSGDDTPEQALIKKSRERAVAAAVNALPDRQKEALSLCYYQGLSAKEAAEVLSVTQGALESLLFRARQTLKEQLDV